MRHNVGRHEAYDRACADPRDKRQQREGAGEYHHVGESEREAAQRLRRGKGLSLHAALSWVLGVHLGCEQRGD